MPRKAAARMFALPVGVRHARSRFSSTSHCHRTTRDVTLDAAHPGPAISSDFEGLRFEMAQLLPGPNGIHYFRPDNRPLIVLFHTLGIKSLRVGGNSSDRNAGRLPSDADLDSFFAFAPAAGVKVIYCLRLHNGDPQADAHTAKYTAFFSTTDGYFVRPLGYRVIRSSHGDQRARLLEQIYSARHTRDLLKCSKPKCLS